MTFDQGIQAIKKQKESADPPGETPDEGGTPTPNGYVRGKIGENISRRILELSLVKKTSVGAK